MKRLTVILALVLLAGCGGGAPESEPPATTATPKTTTATPKTTSAPATQAPKETRPGDPSVYARIAKMRDCAKLQEQFDLAEQTSQRPGGPPGATWSEIGISYMQAAAQRMEELGC